MKIPIGSSLSLLWRYLLPNKRKMVLLFALLFVNIGLQLANPQILRHFIDTASSPAPGELIWIAAFFAGTAVLGNIASGFAAYVGEDVAWSATNALRADLVRHTLGLDMTFHKMHTAGEMIERIDSQFVVKVCGTFVLMFGVLVLMFFEDWRIGLTMTIYALLVLLVMRRAKGVAVPYFKDQRQATADLSAFWEERLSGLEDIRSSGAESHAMRMQAGLMRTVFSKSMRATFFGRFLFSAAIVLFAIGNSAAIASGAALLGLGAVTLGTVYLIFDYTGTLSSNLRMVTEQLDDLQRASAGIERVSELVHMRSAVQDPAVPVALAELHAAHLCFEDVSFAYDDNESAADNAPVLQSVSFELAPGKVLGLLGRTGSGKTTLTRLLFRFYDPVRGRVTLDGVDLRELRIGDLRKRVGLVTQEVQLFQASVRDNLTFFDASISDERILHVIAELGLTDWLGQLPKGLDSELESGAGGLSAGEGQLLAFARVFLADPGLVVLDEASSRLDPATEQRIERAVEKLLRGRTALIIAHHLTTVQRADDILILQDGRILEYGPRRELAARADSRFAYLLRTGLQEVLV
ncbi:MAG: ABC transporter ATP-binding protein [Chloroflexi bacterium]|nr:ABC transporter ATP-binding protein [Chloroflexota bacterium]